MCWCTKNPEFTVKKIADQDIEVFKVVREMFSDGYYGMYYKFEYNVGTTYSSDRNIAPFHYFDGYYKIEDGFHSYNEKRTFVGRLLNLRKEHFFIKMICQNMNVTSAMTFCENKKMLDWYTDIYNCELIKLNCIIPKGSEYYENENGEIVSNCIKIISSEKI